MNRLLARSSIRFYLRHRAQAVLALAGISLGVAVHIGVTIAIDSATRAFEQSAQFVRGQTTHRLLPVGRELTDQTYTELARTLGLRAAPVLEARVRLEGSVPPSSATLLGVDPIEELGFRDFTRFAPSGGISDVNRLITQAGTVLVAPAFLDGRNRVESLRVVTGTGAHALDVVGSLGSDAGDLIVADISTAQELTGQLGVLSRIDLILTSTEARLLEAQLPAGTALVSASNENAAFIELSRAFEINVSALGLLALVVGAFLIYSTMAFAVVQRRKPIAILRAMGVAQADIGRVIAAEAIVMGTLGAIIGIGAGTLLADALVDGVAATIDDFAFRSAVAVASPSPWLYLQGYGLALAVTLIAAARPVREAARIEPNLALQRIAQERMMARSLRIAPFAAAAALFAGATLLLLPTRSLVVAFAGLACMLAAGALLAPVAIVAFTRALEPALARIGGLGAKMAARNVRAQQSRIAVAAAALTIAVATVIGIGLMIGSFRVSLIRWLDTTLTSDVFITAPQAFDEADGARLLESLPQATGMSRSRFIELPTAYGRLGVRAFAPGARGWGLHVVDGPESTTIAALDAGTHIAIAEPFAYRHGLARGDSLTLTTPSGTRELEIIGIYRDYNAGGASITMPLVLYRALWGDDRLDALGLELSAPVAIESLRRPIEDLVDAEPLRVTSTETLKQISLQIFDRTFAITNVLRTLAGIVAFFGMLSALLAVLLERQHELGILRAVGFGPRRLTTLVLTETSLVGLAAGLAAVPIGIVLAGLLVYVINERSFGWTMELILRVPPIGVGIGLALAASLLAGIVPSMKSRRPAKGFALQYE